MRDTERMASYEMGRLDLWPEDELRSLLQSWKRTNATDLGIRVSGVVALYDVHVRARSVL